MTVGMGCKSLEVQTPGNRQFSYPVGAFLQVILFFVLTKGMSAVGPRPTADIHLPMLARHPHRCSGRLGVSERARMSLVSVQSSNLPERPVVEETAAFLGVVPLCL